MTKTGKHGGARAGAGRPAGIEDKRVAEARAAALRQVKLEGPSSLAVQKQIMNFWMGVAAREQQEAGAQNRGVNMKLIVMALDRAGEAAARAHPYEHSRLASVDIGGSKDRPIESVVRVTVTSEEAMY